MIDFNSIMALGPIIPFLFVFGIIYGSLEVAGVFKNRGVNFIIAAAIGIIALSNSGMIEFIYSIIPYATIAFVIIFGIMFLKKTIFAGLGKHLEGKDKKTDYSLIIIILIMVFIFFGNAHESTLINIPYIGYGMNNDILAAVGILLVLAILFIAYKKDPNPPKG